MALPEHKLQKKYSYVDYLKFTDDTRCEIIDGVIYDMTPAPSRRHQHIVGELFGQIRNYLVGKDCKVYVAPFDVRLPLDGTTDDTTHNVVQPDVTVVCDKSKLDDMGCVGAPDWVIEVLSPSTGKKDKREKLKLYRKAGVRCYWIVDPSNELVEVLDFEKNQFGDPLMHGKEDVAKTVFDGFEIKLENLFGE